MAAKKHRQRDELSQVRDTVQSVYVAIVLAFVLRAFMIEAFVIPTGSMADALYGQHFMLECPCCHYEYAFDGKYGDRLLNKPFFVPQDAYCPNCGFRYRDASEPEPVLHRSGDRVLVMKYVYDFVPPRPWDVIVFKNPQNNRENYIKRLIGLPGESIEIIRGDVFVSHDRGETWNIRRKPHAAQQAMWRVLYDNDYPPDPKLAQRAGMNPPAWLPGEGGDLWKQNLHGGRAFRYVGGAKAELHFHPSTAGFLAVNGYNPRPADRREIDQQADRCFDWNLQCVLMPLDNTPAQLTMTFESFGDRIRAEFRTEGQVRLLYQTRDRDASDPNAWTVWGEGDVGAFAPSEGRDVALRFVDYRASVFVDGQQVLASSDEEYPGSSNAIHRLARRRMELQRSLQSVDRELESLRERLDANGGDAAERAEWNAEQDRLQRLQKRLMLDVRGYAKPRISIAAVGGELQLEHIQLLRDVYYTAPAFQVVEGNGAQYDYVRSLTDTNRNFDIPETWRLPENGAPGWGTADHPIHLRKAAEGESSDMDEYFCLGDNSPQSLDGRGWTAAAPSLRLYDDEGQPIYQLGTVPGYNILGRGLLVYWPAAYRLPGLNIPIVPDVGRMRLIR